MSDFISRWAKWNQAESTDKTDKTLSGSFVSGSLKPWEIDFIARVFDGQNQIGEFVILSIPDIIVKFFSGRFQQNVILAPDGFSNEQLLNLFPMGKEETVMIFHENKFVNLNTNPEPKYIESLQRAIIVPLINFRVGGGEVYEK